MKFFDRAKWLFVILVMILNVFVDLESMFLFCLNVTYFFKDFNLGCYMGSKYSKLLCDCLVVQRSINDY